MKEGHRIVCLADFRFRGDDPSEPPCRDICHTRAEPPDPNSKHEDVRTLWYLAAGCRGIEYIGGVRDTEDAFKAQCAKANLEWLVPSALPLEPRLPNGTQIPPPGTYIRGSGTYIEPGFAKHSLHRVPRLFLFKEYSAKIVIRHKGKKINSADSGTSWDHYGYQRSVIDQIKEAKLTMQHDDIKPTDDLTLEVVRITAHTWKVPQEHRFYTEHDKVPFPDFDRTDAGTLIKPPAPEQIEEVVWTSREPDKMPADLPLS